MLRRSIRPLWNQVVRLKLENLEERLCLTQNPYLFVDSYGNDSIMRYDQNTGTPAPADGQMGAVFVLSGSGSLGTPLSLNITPAGTLIVDNAEQNRIYQYDALTGDYLGQFISFGDGGLQAPTGMIFSPDSCAGSAATKSAFIKNNADNGASTGRNMGYLPCKMEST